MQLLQTYFDNTKIGVFLGHIIHAQKDFSKFFLKRDLNVPQAFRMLKLSHAFSDVC